jgi:glycosyltransferase involved in cell wall biosynthesis
LNEIVWIDACLASLAAQDYEGPITVFVADGGSDDGTRERLAAWEREPSLAVKVVDNRARNQASGLNLAVAAATDELLVRADAHTTYDPDYIRNSVESLIETGATAVGGRQLPQASGGVAAATVSAMASRLAVGTARYRHSTDLAEADTVYLGAYRKSDFERLGGYRHLPGGVAEDADLYYRWRRRGATVILDPSIKSAYHPRDTWKGLAKQYFRYGWGKADMLYLNRRLPSARPLAPLLLVAGLLLALLVGVFAGAWWPALALATGWSLALVAVAVGARGSITHRLTTAIATAVIHACYGSGLLAGLARGPGPIRHLRPG